MRGWVRSHIVGILSLSFAVLTSLVGVGVNAAFADTRLRLAVVEARQAQDQKERRLVIQKLDALCRAIPQAQCPLGTE